MYSCATPFILAVVIFAAFQSLCLIYMATRERPHAESSIQETSAHDGDRAAQRSPKIHSTRTDNMNHDPYGMHTIVSAFGIIRVGCNIDFGSAPDTAGEVLREGTPHTLHAIFNGDAEAPFIARVCIASHPHFHAISLRFMSENKGSEQCSAHISTTSSNPHNLNWDWRVMERPLTIHTYAEEFDNANGFFISIRSTHTGQDCSMQLIIAEMLIEEVVTKSSLRGSGQVVLPSSVRNAFKAASGHL